MPKRLHKTRPNSPTPRGAFELGGQHIPAGSAQQIALPVTRAATGGMLTLDVLVVHGRQPGPVVWLSSAIHGDELNGIAINRRVLRSIDPALLRGTLLSVPVVNVFGLLNESRYLPDRRDLNRSFPGSKRGSLASQLAHLFASEVVGRSEFGIDLHTGSGGRTNLPQIRCDLDDATTRAAASAFRAPVTLHSALRDGSLRACARDLGVPVLLYETGEAGRFDPEGIRIGTAGVLRVLQHLKMCTLDSKQHPATKEPVVRSRGSHWERATRSGFCEMQSQLGDVVRPGQPMATIFAASGKEEGIVKASSAGIVIGLLSRALVHKGEAVAHIAELARPPTRSLA